MGGGIHFLGVEHHGGKDGNSTKNEEIAQWSDMLRKDKIFFLKKVPITYFSKIDF